MKDDNVTAFDPSKRLAEAIREVKNATADRDDVIIEMREAERMRLERIRVICADPCTADDVRDVFNRIVVQEEFHERAFREFTTDDAMQRTLDGHLAGLNALGLKP